MSNLVQVVLTEPNRENCVSSTIARFQDSWFTHVIIITGDDTFVEAGFPKVRKGVLSERLKELRDQDRAYVVLDCPELSEQQRLRIAANAKKFVGRWYDVGQLILFALKGKFVKDGLGTLVCSRVVSGAYWPVCKLFDETTVSGDDPRAENKLSGYITPADLLTTPKLKVVGFKPSSRIPKLPADIYAGTAPYMTSLTGMRVYHHAF